MATQTVVFRSALELHHGSILCNALLQVIRLCVESQVHVYHITTVESIVSDALHHLLHSSIVCMPAASVKLMYAPQPQPRQIQALADFTVTKVACGQNHTLALTKEGQAFTWGEPTCLGTCHISLSWTLCLQLYELRMQPLCTIINTVSRQQKGLTTV